MKTLIYIVIIALGFKAFTEADLTELIAWISVLFLYNLAIKLTSIDEEV
jgi:hypothetical protein